MTFRNGIFLVLLTMLALASSGCGGEKDADPQEDGDTDEIDETKWKSCEYDYLGNLDGHYCMGGDIYRLTYDDCYGSCTYGRSCQLTFVKTCGSGMQCIGGPTVRGEPTAHCECGDILSCDCEYGNDIEGENSVCKGGDIYEVSYHACEGSCASGATCSLSLLEECEEGTECVETGDYQAECLPTDGDLDDDGEAGEGEREASGEGADESEVEIENGETDGDTENDTEPETDAEIELDFPDGENA